MMHARAFAMLLLLIMVTLSLLAVPATAIVAKSANFKSADSNLGDLVHMSASANVGRVVKVHSVYPAVGSVTGGTRLHIRGEGFATDTYGGRNRVLIGDQNADGE
jgi:hypothetical protein